MAHLSVKISDYLHQQLEAKTHEMGLPSISDAVRVLLSAALENVTEENNKKIQNKILQHVVTLHIPLAFDRSIRVHIVTHKYLKDFIYNNFFSFI